MLYPMVTYILGGEKGAGWDHSQEAEEGKACRWASRGGENHSS